MRISDWGADVCSSDLGPMSPAHAVFPPENAASAFMPFGDALYLDCAARTPMLRSVHAAGLAALAANATPWTQSSDALEADRKSAVLGQSGSVSVDLGGGRICKKKRSVIQI